MQKAWDADLGCDGMLLSKNGKFHKIWQLIRSSLEEVQTQRFVPIKGSSNFVDLQFFSDALGRTEGASVFSVVFTSDGRQNVTRHQNRNGIFEIAIYK